MTKKNQQRAKNNIVPSGTKETAYNVDPESYIKKPPVWNFSKLDFEHSKWCPQRCDNFIEVVIKKLKHYEGMTWQDIDAAAGGKRRGTNNHSIPIDKLCKEARDRLLEVLKIYDDELYSLRLDGTTRLFGIRNDGVFNMIWYDPDHEICPSNKK